MTKLSKVAEICKGALIGNDATFAKVSIDSRALKPGDLFVALKGEQSDGHDYIDAALKAGASGALVSRPVSTTLPLIQVSDTLKALQQFAAYQREQMNIPCIAVTGSCGKTTTRGMLASVFSLAGKTLASEKSYNNDIGVPLTLAGLSSDDQFLISELGANHAGEIAQLAKWAKPTVAIITNAGPAHLAGFGSLEGVARAKGEIFEALPTDGTAIVNLDDQFADFWKTLVGSRRIVTFGLDPKADVSAKNIQMNEYGEASFTLCLKGQEVNVTLPLLGKHNVLNALAVAAAAYSQNISLDKIQKGLQAAAPETRRLVKKQGYQSATVIDDSYNANPLSVTAAIHVLAQKKGKRFLVFGDMLELGENSRPYHESIGKEARRCEIDYLYCYGDHSEEAAKAFGDNAYFYRTQEELIEDVKKRLQNEKEPCTLLIKGSLGMRMNQVVAALSI